MSESPAERVTRLTDEIARGMAQGTTDAFRRAVRELLAENEHLLAAVTRYENAPRERDEQGRLLGPKSRPMLGSTA